MESGKKKDLLIQFFWFGIPVLAVFVVSFFSDFSGCVVSKGNALQESQQQSVTQEIENPYKYDIGDMKKVSANLIEYREMKRIPV